MWQLFGVDTTPREMIDYWKEQNNRLGFAEWIYSSKIYKEEIVLNIWGNGRIIKCRVKKNWRYFQLYY